MPRPGAWGGRLLALALGAALVLAFEGLLRLVPGLAPPPFALELARVGEESLHSINPDYAARFFTGSIGGQSLRGMKMTPRPYLEPRAARELRILFAGGSTVQGYPHPRRLAAAAYVQAMLRDAWPERRVEVFNAGITALASFAVARTVEDAVAALGPDLVVVYTGHNELYGVYGTASLRTGGGGLAAKQLYYALMQWRLSALLRTGLGYLRGAGQAPPRSLLQVMAAAGLVEPGDARRVRALHSLGENLRGLAAFCRARAIPLVLCTLASNESGFAPAHSAAPSSLRRRAQWRQWVEEARRLLKGGRPPARAHRALGLLDSAAALFSSQAEVQFLRGRALVALGREEEAHRAFIRARDLDPRPWRAPAAANELIRATAAREKVLLADVAAAFERAGPAAGVGWALMADHLHFSIPGQLLMARTLVRSLRAAPPPLRLRPQDEARLRSDAAYGRQQGDSPVEQLAVAQAMRRLLSEPPLDQGNEEQVAHLDSLSRVLWARLRPGERRGVERWRSGSGPDLLALSVADQLFGARDWAGAQQYYSAARREEPYTVWGDIWATLRWGRCIELQRGELDAGARAQVAAALRRLRFLAQAPDFPPGYGAFFEGYGYHLLGRRPQALARLEEAMKDGRARRTFLFDLLWLSGEELVAAGRGAELESYLRRAAGAAGREEMGEFLLEQIRARDLH